MDIHAELLDRIRSAHRREMSMTAALAGEIVAATTHLSSLHAQEREARRRADAWPRDPRRDNMTPEERNSANLAEDDARRVLRHVERAAGRPAISEQTALRDHADAGAVLGPTWALLSNSSRARLAGWIPRSSSKPTRPRHRPARKPSVRCRNSRPNAPNMAGEPANCGKHWPRPSDGRRPTASRRRRLQHDHHLRSGEQRLD